VALEEDLSTEIARPALAELASVAEGVASLARGLADAQREREALSIELGRRERLAALGRVVAGVAHEVRNPLASMKLRVDVARSSENVPASVVAELDAVDEEIGRLDRLVTNFLVVSGRRIGPRVDSDLGELARKRIAQLAPWAKEQGVSLAVLGSARAVVDPEACARAVDNLVKNAVEASSPGAEVRVRIERREGVAAMAVEDHGPGVPEDRVHELFEPFFTTKPDGTGLGLAVSRAIAVASGGQLSYRRDEGVTRFELALSTEGVTA
jgi:signal transduction histidine kinase